MQQSLPPLSPAPDERFLHLAGDANELRIAKIFERRAFLLVPFLVLGAILPFAGSLWLMLGVGALWQILGAWMLILAGPMIFFYGVWDFARRRRTPDEWVVNVRERRLEHNEMIVARFEEMRALWVRSQWTRQGHEHTLFLSLHQNQKFHDLALDHIIARDGDRAELVHAARWIAHASGTRYEERG